MSSFSDKNIDSLKGLGKVRLDERFTKEELKEMCRERDLHVSGDKEDLINNLMKWKKKLSQSNKKQANTPSKLKYDNNNNMDLEYLVGLGKVKLDENFTKDQLKDMCRERDLHVSGTKNDLINNLIRWKSNLPSTLKKKGNVKKELFVNNNNTNIATTNNSRVAALKEMYGGLKNDSKIDPDKEHLYVEVTEKDALYQKMVECEKLAPVTGIVLEDTDGEKEPNSIRLPMWKPLVCVSFPGYNLRGRDFQKKGRSDSVINLESEKIGREPWGVCDYIRDALYWPMDFMFIDGEQCGAYDVDHYMVEEKKHLLRNGKMEGKGYRNWKRLFTWAQQEAKLNLYFISSAWLNSPYCLGELADLIGIQYSESNYSSDDDFQPCGLYFVVLDDAPVKYTTEEDFKKIGTLKKSIGDKYYKEHFQKFESQEFTAKEFCKEAADVIIKMYKGVIDKLTNVRQKELNKELWFNYRIGKEPYFNLCKFGDFFNIDSDSKKEKMKLRDACDECVALKNRIKLFFEEVVYKTKKEVEGDYSVQRAERDICTNNIEYGDYENARINERKPIRNRYALDEADRRFRINDLTTEEVFPSEDKQLKNTGILPHVGLKTWEKIQCYIEKKGIIVDAEDFRNIDGIGKKTVEDLLPLITFVTDKVVKK